jgi:hypothetical protein
VLAVRSSVLLQVRELVLVGYNLVRVLGQVPGLVDCKMV